MKKTVYATPQDAEAAFYDAFSRNDLEAMMAVWADDEEIYCIHPQGGRVTGIAEVRESWRQIFKARQALVFTLQHQHCLQGMMIAVHSVFENIAVEGQSARGTAVATNVYLRSEGGWRMIVHHASPVPPAASPQSRTAPKTLH